MSDLLLVYTVMDAWREKYHSIFIADDDDSNIICIDCRKCILHKKTVSKTVIGQIKDIINKTDIASFKYKPCDKDDCFTDGVINHFFINGSEMYKEIEVHDMSRVKNEEIQPVKEMLKGIKDILVSEGIEEYYLSLLFE